MFHTLDVSVVCAARSGGRAQVGTNSLEAAYLSLTPILTAAITEAAARPMQPRKRLQTRNRNSSIPRLHLKVGGAHASLQQQAVPQSTWPWLAHRLAQQRNLVAATRARCLRIPGPEFTRFSDAAHAFRYDPF